MKPLILKIEGLNSFEEEQVVDFQKLTQYGLFGIFGDTGSGKSTILDGMTLALYGEMPRGTKNFINVNRDRCKVNFQFSMTVGAETKEYEIYREFRKDKTLGTARSYIVRFTEMGDTPLILAEKKMEADKLIESYLGLNFQDFTRTVVLPQGKFSEFLKLEGAQRNVMLERLFHLQEYGIQLTEKIKLRKQKYDENLLVLDGKLEVLGEISKEKREAKQKERNEKVEKVKEKENNIQELKKKQDAEEQLMQMLKEKQTYERRAQYLNEKREEMNQNQKRFENGSKVKLLIPFWQMKNEIEKRWKEGKSELEAAKKQKEICKKGLQKSKMEFEDCLQIKEIEIPKINKKIELLEEINGEQKEKVKIVNEIEQKEKEKSAQEEVYQQREKELEKMQEKLQKTEEQLEKAEQELIAEEKAEIDDYGQFCEIVLAEIREKTKKGDICPVCKRVVSEEISMENKEQADGVAKSDSSEHYFLTYKNRKELIRKKQEMVNEFRKQEKKLNKEVEIQKQKLMNMKEKLLSVTYEVKQLKIIFQEQKSLLIKKLEESEIVELLEKNLEELKQEIFYYDFSTTVAQLKSEKDIIEKKKKIAEENYEKLQKQTQKLQEKVAVYEGKVKAESQNYKKSEIEFQNAMKTQKISDENQMQQYYCPEDELVEIEKTIESYKKDCIENQSQLKRVSEKIGNRTLSEKEWKETKDLLNRETVEVENLKQKIQVLDIEISQQMEKEKEQKELQKQKKEIERKLSIVDDLDKLFMGKKFVKFVSAEKLQYIAVQASATLKYISGGTYGLEVDEQGNFYIRDYKNGGITRNAATLSGGETFLVSLSLALALSANIQLNGKANLELFFLDEGFGSLDENLLDTVMEVLEKLQNEKRKIGFITHIEKMKERVPKKLLVHAAEAGKKGSWIEME